MNYEDIQARNFLVDNTCRFCKGWPICMRSSNKNDTCENFKFDPEKSYIDKHKDLINRIKQASSQIRNNITRNGPNFIISNNGTKIFIGDKNG